MNDIVNVFAGAHFDRIGHRRRDRKWLQSTLDNGSARVVGVWRHRTPLTAEEDALLLLSPAQLDQATLDELILLGEIDDTPCFACDLGQEENAPDIDGVFHGLRSAASVLPAAEAALVAYAQAMVNWHRRHRYCGQCGCATRVDEAGHIRRCGDCRQSIFPRIDPAIIVLVEHDGRALLGRQATWPEGMYSTIAGFVEPGESLEDAVRREVAEETGVVVGAVAYCSSQPWPFPSSLMLGFTASAETTAITLHDNELEDARWFSRDQLAEALRAGEVSLPTPFSISTRLLRDWYDDGQRGRLDELVQSITTS